MKIIDKYILRDHLGPLAFALTALTSLLLLNYIAKQFGNLVGKGLPWQVIAEFFMLSLPFTVAMTLPMAVLVATLYAFSRLAAENEITALKANGVSMVRLLVPVLLGAAMFSLIMIAFNDQVLPRSNHRLRQLQGDIARKKPTFALRAQVINEVSPGRLYLRANHIDEYSNRMREITIYDLSDPLRRRTIYADSGNMALSSNAKDLILDLYSGYMQEVPRNDPSQLQRLFYGRDRVRVAGVANTLDRTTDDNFKSDREMSICEMQREVSQFETQFSAARHDLQEALIGATREATTGKVPMLTYVPPPPSSGQTVAGPATAGAKKDFPVERTQGLGSAYCGLLAKLGTLPAIGPKSAEAREAGNQKQDTAGSQARAADSASRAAADSARRAAAASVKDSTGALAPTTTNPAVAALPTPLVPQAGALPPQPLVLASAIDAARSRMTESRRQMNAYQVEIQKKFALSAACVVFVLIGAPIALRFPRGGVGLTIGVSLGVFALYYVGLIAGESLADRDLLPPWAAMWAANVILTIVGLLLLARMGREGSTSRGGDLSELVDSLRGLLARIGRSTGLPLERRSV